MRKIIFTLLPSLLLLVGITAFKVAGTYRRANVQKRARYAVAAQKQYIQACGGAIIYGDGADEIPALPGWGNYTWKITTNNDSAQFYFNQGINMYYAFHIIESTASFEKAIRFDSTCAMAWFGKALSMGPNINYGNGYRSPTEAWQAAAKSKAYYANCTALERDMIEALQQRYSPDTAAGINELKQHYIAAMQLLSDKYNTNADVVALYADAIMVLHPWDMYEHDLKPKPWTPVIQKVLEHALALNPRHPGANHYYVHTMEGSEHPEMAQKSAETLGTLMPGVSHLVHMPSHIYIRTGYYKQGITVNDSAVAAYGNYSSMYSPATYGIALYSYHNTHLKATCAQMAGNFADAMAAANTLRRDLPAEYMLPNGAMGNLYQYAYQTMTLTQVRFGKWNDILQAPVNDTMIYAGLLQHFARGMAYSRKHQPAAAMQELQLLQKSLQNKTLKEIPDPFSNAYDAGLVAESILQGAIAEDGGQLPQAIAAFEKAVIAGDNLVYNEPRDWSLPARQYLGNVLLKTKDYTKAITVFNRDLVINPNNGWSLTGLLLAYRAMGKTIDVQKTAERLQMAFSIKDVEVERPVY